MSIINCENTHSGTNSDTEAHISKKTQRDAKAPYLDSQDEEDLTVQSGE